MQGAELVSTGQIAFLSGPFAGQFASQSISEVRDSDVRFTSVTGDVEDTALRFQGTFGTVNVVNTTFEVDGSVTFYAQNGLLTYHIADSNFVIGNDAIAATQVPRLVFVIEGTGTTFDYTNNTAAFHNGGQFEVYVEPGNQLLRSQIRVADSTFAGSGGQAFTVHYEGSNATEVQMRVTDNVFTGFDRAVELSSTTTTNIEFSARFADNIFDFDISALGDVAILEDIPAATTTVDASKNVWGTNTDTSTVEGYIYSNTGEPEVFEVAPITQP